MTRKNMIFVLTLGLFLLFTTFSFANGINHCPDVLGDWDIDDQMIQYELNVYKYQQLFMIMHITNQNGCLFYGYIEIPDDPEDISIFTGALDGLKVTITENDSTTRGELSGYDRNRRLFTKMKYISSELGTGDLDSAIVTHKGIATRK